ncbi:MULTISPECIES: hypothetical protein [Pseudomonas]|uniref:hypothetical protein n=1 Tax=Pseudomonas TaxID=286 RepID=UPI0018D6511E|nr:MULTISPECIES: hypothetical protein [Pseudomonas]MBH3374751.1 hypothetical protein [Pseudomonas juntendi]MBS6039227.1 hypothetical protein [Pseudomonas sp.]CAH0647343.1 hypothetical protein PSNVIR_01591 [Pseudomonas sp. Nvir]
MDVRRIHKTAIKHIHIHNDISNTANHLRKRVEEMEATGNREGILLDVTACLVMLAFASESRINFIGAKKVENWDEWKPFHIKVNMVFKELGIKPDRSQRPYSAIKRLQEFRNIIAHGKPSVVLVDEVVEVGPEERYDDVDLGADWEKCLSTDFMRQCSDDIDQIWKLLLEVAGIELHEALTHGSYSFDLIEVLPRA